MKYSGTISNQDKTIATNSIILYLKLFVVTVSSFFTTRFALQALGVDDYGLFTVLGSVIAFISIFNNIMISTSNRFISVAIGRNNNIEINEQFNINLSIHILIALFTLLIAVPLGDLYISRCLNFNGDILVAKKVFHYTIIGSIVSFIAVPYNGLLMAKEKFAVFSITEVCTHLLKLVVSYLLLFFFQQKLLIFAFTQGIITAIPLFVYYIYCKKYYPDIVRFKVVRNKAKYGEVFKFSGWVAYGAFAFVGKNQASSILINLFFNTAMNAALGLANTVNSLVNGFAKSISQPIAPQITKNYASGNSERAYALFILSNKLTFFVTLLISIPFFVNPNWIFSLWLGQVPEYVVPFTQLVIVDTLIISLNSGINNLIFAHGDIKLYQFSVSTLRFVAIVFAYFVLRSGFSSVSLLYTYILFSIVIFFTGQWVLHRTIAFDNSILWRKSYLPSILVCVLVIPCIFLRNLLPSIVHIIISELWLSICILFIGFTGAERSKIISFLFNRKSI